MLLHNEHAWENNAVSSNLPFSSLNMLWQDAQEPLIGEDHIQDLVQPCFISNYDTQQSLLPESLCPKNYART